jgi:hypothetical protein
MGPSVACILTNYESIGVLGVWDYRDARFTIEAKHAFSDIGSNLGKHVKL